MGSMELNTPNTLSQKFPSLVYKQWEALTIIVDPKNPVVIN